MTAERRHPACVGLKLRTIRLVPHKTLETRLPELSDLFRANAESFGAMKKIVEGSLPLHHNAATPIALIAGIQPLFVEASSAAMVTAVVGWHSFDIAHAFSTYAPGAQGKVYVRRDQM